MAAELYKINPSELQQLLDALQTAHYKVIGPTIEQDAIVYENITSVADLPIGWTEIQDKGAYSLQKRQDQALFGYNVGPNSWKKYLFPAERKLASLRLCEGEFVTDEALPVPSYAFLGVRACDLHAVMMQDRIFLQDNTAASYYQKVREQALFIGVNCTVFAENCFCTSMQTGPALPSGADIELTEVCADEHYLLLCSKTAKGQVIVETLSLSLATEQQIAAAEQRVSATASTMTKQFNNTGVKELLARQHDNPIWQEIAEKCLHCGNCTLVCPTCFCSRVEDTVSLEGSVAERWQRWDSCFTVDHSYIHGGSVRKQARSRYRQWLTHKFSSWYDQFAASGCVGCGRCITWCPVGIDVTTEISQIRASEGNNERD